MPLRRNRRAERARRDCIARAPSLKVAVADGVNRRASAGPPANELGNRTPPRYLSSCHQPYRIGKCRGLHNNGFVRPNYTLASAPPLSFSPEVGTSPFRNQPSESRLPAGKGSSLISERLWPKPLDLRIERRFDRPVRRSNGDYARPGIGDTAGPADALDLRTLLREFASAQD